MLPQVDVMGDVVNYVVLRDMESDYEYFALAVMCTSAWDRTNLAFWRKRKNRKES